MDDSCVFTFETLHQPLQGSTLEKILEQHFYIKSYRTRKLKTVFMHRRPGTSEFYTRALVHDKPLDLSQHRNKDDHFLFQLHKVSPEK